MMCVCVCVCSRNSSVLYEKKELQNLLTAFKQFIDFLQSLQILIAIYLRFKIFNSNFSIPKNTFHTKYIFFSLQKFDFNKLKIKESL